MLGKEGGGKIWRTTGRGAGGRHPCRQQWQMAPKRGTVELRGGTEVLADRVLPPVSHARLDDASGGSRSTLRASSPRLMQAAVALLASQGAESLHQQLWTSPDLSISPWYVGCPRFLCTLSVLWPLADAARPNYSSLRPLMKGVHKPNGMDGEWAGNMSQERGWREVEDTDWVDKDQSVLFCSYIPARIFSKSVPRRSHKATRILSLTLGAINNYYRSVRGPFWERCDPPKKAWLFSKQQIEILILITKSMMTWRRIFLPFKLHANVSWSQHLSIRLNMLVSGTGLLPAFSSLLPQH